MYAGRVVERAAVRALFADPRHPYTSGLLGARPRLDRDAARLVTIDGAVPPPDAMPAGCAFAAALHPGGPALRGAEPAVRPNGAGHATSPAGSPGRREGTRHDRPAADRHRRLAQLQRGPCGLVSQAPGGSMPSTDVSLRHREPRRDAGPRR
jgi:oligopeptide/dipeptide ABC transporter ATP-binding protein